MNALEQETTEVLQHLVRFDTVNPPGNERPAQEYLAGILRDAGFDCELLADADESRPNLLARLGDPGDGPTMCLLGHVDTVLANADDWTHGPWSGDLADGYLWGRGALDMKSQVAAEVVAAASLGRTGWRPTGQLLVCAVVDEETGGRHGAQFLTEQHPDKVRCDLLLNEGGGGYFDYEGRRWYAVGCGEKGVYRFNVTTDGIAGHASNPRLGDNALLKMAPLLQRLAERQPGFDMTPEPAAMLDQMGLGADPGSALEQLEKADPRLALFMMPMLGVTLAPTRISASQKINVIPSSSELRIDCRVPPGLDDERVLHRIQEVLGSDGYRLDFTEQVPGNRSSADSELMVAIREWVAEHDPDAEVVPYVLPAFTDSRWFRAAFPECVAYGFFPHRHMDLFQTWPLIHAADERIDVRELGFAAGCYAELARRML